MTKLIDYYFKSRKILIIFLTGVVTGMMVLPNIGSKFIIDNFSFISIILAIILSFVLPLFFFSFAQKKKAADSYLSLPLSRTDLLNGTLLSVIAISIIAITPGCIISMVLASQPELLMVFKLYLCLIVLIIGLEIINSLFYLIAYNVFDGVVMTLAYTFMPFILYFGYAYFFTNFVAGFTYGFGAYGPSTLFFRLISPLWNGIYQYLSILGNTNNDLIGRIIFVIETIAAYIILLIYFNKRKSEKISQVSDSFMAYPFVITYYVFVVTCIICFAYFEKIFSNALIIFLMLLLFACYIVANFVYRRQIKITKHDFIFFLVAITLCYFLSLSAKSTKGYGLSYAYNKHPERVAYIFEGTVNLDEIKINGGVGDWNEEGSDTYITFKLFIEGDGDNQEVRDVMEKYRLKQIDEFYNEEKYYGPKSNLQVIDNYEENDENILLYRPQGEKYYYYYSKATLTLEDLKVIAKYTKITAYNVCTDTEVYIPEEASESIVINDYLK